MRSLRDFVGDLPDELLLCPVCALWVYLDHSSSLLPRPHSLFVSPHAPSHPLSKNALSFFLRSVILQSSSSSSSTLSSSSSARSSSFPAHSICGMATSTAFSRNVSLSSILEAASWRSSVFASFYLMCSFHLAMGFRWVPSLLQVLCCNGVGFFSCFCFRFRFYSLFSAWRWVSWGVHSPLSVVVLRQSLLRLWHCPAWRSSALVPSPLDRCVYGDSSRRQLPPI